MSIFAVMVIFLFLAAGLLLLGLRTRRVWFANEVLSHNEELLMAEYVAAAADLAAARRAQYASCCGATLAPCLALCSRSCPRSVGCSVFSLKRSAAALRHMGQAHRYLEYVALRSRFVWRRGLRHTQEFRIKSAAQAAQERAGVQSLNASPELVEALSDIRAGRLYSTSREKESFLFDSHGQLQQRLRGFDFALYLSNRTERVVSDLVELPWQVWLCMLLLCSAALVTIQLVSAHSPLVLVGVGFAFPLLLAVLLSRLAWMQQQLLNPTLLHRSQLKAVQSINHTLDGGRDVTAVAPELSFKSTDARGSIAELERYITARLEQPQGRSLDPTATQSSAVRQSTTMGLQVQSHRVSRGFMTHESNKPAYLRAGDAGHHTKISAHLHFKFRQQAAMTKLNKQLSLFPCGSRGPSTMMTALRISVFGTAVYLGVFAIIMSTTTVELYGNYSVFVFIGACLPVICSALLASQVLPLFVVCTSVEYLKSPREVEHVVRATKVRQALRALRLLLAFLYQAQATQSILKQRGSAASASLEAMSIPSADKYRPDLVARRSRASSRTADLKKPLLSLSRAGDSRVAFQGRNSKRGVTSSMLDASDSSDSDSGSDEIAPLAPHERLMQVHTEAQLEAAFELRSSRVAQVQADQIAESIRRRAAPVRRAVSAAFTLKSTDNVRAVTGKINTKLVMALTDPSCLPEQLQQYVPVQAMQGGNTTALPPAHGGSHVILGMEKSSVNSPVSALNDFTPRRRRRPLVHLRALVELRRHGAEFEVPRHIGVAATQARERQDVYEAFGLLDLSGNGSLGAEDVRRCLAAVGVHWGPKPEHAEATDIVLRYINVRYGGASSCSPQLNFQTFYAWAKEVENNTACKTTLAELLMRELADGAQDASVHLRDVKQEQLSATSFRRVLHALNLALSLDDVRVLFRDANPSGRPDVLSFQGLQSLLEKHL